VEQFTEPGLFTGGIEGPACDRDGNLYAVSFGDKRTIGRVTPNGKAGAWVQLPEGSTGNGIRFNQAGEMFVADYTGHNIVKIDPKTKDISVFAHEPKMHQANDITISEDGTIYASDPDWKNGVGALWRISTDGIVTQLADNKGTTNGIEVSPDGKTLYVADIGDKKTYAYTIAADGTLNNRRLFCELGSDGMTIDIAGNVYLTGRGVHVFNPQGKKIAHIPVPQGWTANVCFGGKDRKTLFMTAKTGLYSLQMTVAGVKP